MKKKIIIAAALVVVIMAAFTITSFATDISTEETIYIGNNEYYLMRWYNNTASNFRIYVQQYNDSPFYNNDNNFNPDGESNIIIDQYYGYVVNTEDHMDIKYNNLSSILPNLIYHDPFVVMNSLLYSFIGDKVIDIAENEAILYSKLFNGTLMIDAFNKGYYAFNSEAIDPNTTDYFHYYIDGINTGQVEYYDIGFDFFTGSLKDAFNYTYYLTHNYYDLNGNELPKSLYYGYTSMFRDKLCYSLFNLLYYELGYTNITWNDIQSSIWYNYYYGINGSYTGQMIKLNVLQLEYNYVMVPSNYITSSNITGIVGVKQFIEQLDYKTVVDLLKPFSNYIYPILIFSGILFTCTIIIAGKKVLLV